MRLYPFIRPVLFALPPEWAHGLSVWVLSWVGHILPRPKPDDYILATRALGQIFTNPFGVAAGFDKNGEVPDALLRLGFGFVEIGTVTPRPQSGNPKPRLFRLVEQEAVINRLGFNNQGHEAVRVRLSRRAPEGIIGVNIGANKDAKDRLADYEAGARVFGEHAGYLTLNVSSPNTPNLRDLQSKAALKKLIDKVQKAAPDTPVLVKIAPDLSEKELQDIADVALASKIDGLIVSNTTIDKTPVRRHIYSGEEGGLSGRPLMEKSTAVLAQLRRLTGGKVTLIGVGGVSTAEEAYAKIRAGASLIQFYSALVFHGVGLVGRLKRELAELLRADGFDSLHQAVGVDVPLGKKKVNKKETKKMTVTIYHNPRCSKSRQTLALLEKRGEKIKVVEYLNAPLGVAALKTVLKKLKMASARDLMRRNEAEYKELGLKDVQSEAKLLAALAKHPKLMERPLVVKGNKAALGRPPEQVLDIL